MTESDYQEREQSGLKHYALRLYLDAATRILGSAWDLKYVDYCAGPWESKTADHRDSSFGIAIKALTEASHELASRDRAPKISCLLIEKKLGRFVELEKYAKAKNSAEFRVEARNWDFTTHTSDIVQFCSTPRTFSFVLIDPCGWQLAGISQIAPLLKLRPGEVLINLMSSFITRFLKDNKTDFSDLLGEDFPELRNLTGIELEFAVVRKYCEQIKRVGGFKYVCALPVMKPDSDSFNFHLIYATRHAKGVEVFKNVEKRTESQTHAVRARIQQRQRQQRTGRMDLFPAQVLYSGSNYQEQFAEMNSASAKQQVLDLLRSSQEVPYDDCWAEALQYSAVYEADLRTWIDEWEKAGAVAVTGKRPTERVLKRNAGHALRYSGIKSPNTP
jgi:three-Cys-motif partner protein